MATLEKIRNKKAWLTIVIGGALLAFIIQGGVEMFGRFGSKTTAAMVGNEKIDVMRFQQRYEEEVAKDQQNNSKNQTDPAIRQQQVLEDMINEALLEQEYKKLGINVSDDEITKLMTGKEAAPAVVQFAQQAGAKSPLELFDIITNPGKHGIQKEQIKELEKEYYRLRDDIVKQYKFAKLQNLMAGCMQANNLDRANMADEDAITNVVTFAKKEYSTIPDDKYPVSDTELKAEWEKLKPMFKSDEEIRFIHYIAVNIDPNQEDIAAANKIADAAAEVGTTRRDSTVNNHHVMYKLINKQTSLDSIELSYVIVQGDAKTQKAVLDQLNTGKSLDDVKKAYPQKVDGKLKEWQRIFNAPDSMKTKIANANDAYFVYMATDQGATLMKVDSKKPAKLFYTLATVSYDAYASTKTSENLRDKFQDFLNKNKTSKDFEENAAKAGFNAVEMMITPSTAQLGLSSFGQGGIKDTRKAIKWAFEKNTKEGEVSPIFSDNNNTMVAVALDNIYDDGYFPYNFTQGKEFLARRIRNQKKADDLMKQYQGKANDLNGYAAVMGVSVDTTNFVFSAGDPKLEPRVQGRIATTKLNTLQGPFKGDDAVYVYQVVKQEKSERKPTKEELDNRYAQRNGAQVFANPRKIYSILSKASKVKKSLIDSY